MKILIVSRRGPTNADRKGGAQEYILKLAEQLIKQGHSVLILCGGEKLDNRPLPSTEVVNNVNVTRLASGKAKNLLKETLRIYKNYDVTIENIMAFALNIPLYIPSEYPFFVIRHHLQKRNFLKLQGKVKGLAGMFFESVIEPLVYRHATFFAASDLTKQELEHRWVKPACIYIANPGFDFIPFYEVPKTVKPSVFFVGYLNIARKKVDDLILAFKEVLKTVPDAELFIGGEGPDKAFLENMAKSLPVKFLGFLKDDQKHFWYRQSWVFASPSSSEGFGITWIEANAHGTPVVGYELGLNTVNESCASMVEVGNIAALAEAIIGLLTNEKERMDKSQGGIVNAQKFSWEYSAGQIEKIIVQRLNKAIAT